MRTGIIAGSGFYNIEGVEVKGLEKISTPFGAASDVYRICEFEGREFVFLSRHGTPHHIAPHKVNYRANIWGLRELGAERILSINAVGGINTEMAPGDIVIPDQVIDMTHGRASTFYEAEEVVHIDFTTPYCPELREYIFKAGDFTGTKLKKNAVYVCTNGPRLETPAEIRFFAGAGADVVGMTGMPEACLARELELCYAGIAIITNPAAGISAGRLTTFEVVETMKASLETVKLLLMETIRALPDKRRCACPAALKDARI